MGLEREVKGATLTLIATSLTFVGLLALLPALSTHIDSQLTAHLQVTEQTPPEVDPILGELLRRTAINKEIMMIIANHYAIDGIKLQVSTLRRANISNYMVVTLDMETSNACREMNVSIYKRPDLLADGIVNTFRVSGLKFRLLRDILLLEYSVLVSDVDIVYFQNPFAHLHRDVDVEGSTDGYDNATAYGYLDTRDDPNMGRSRRVWSTRVFVFNSGLFFLRPSPASLSLVERIYDRVKDQKGWDQLVYNEELFYPSRPGYKGLTASKRVMDYLLFMNSKVFFTTVRKQPERFAKFLPVAVHLNYHGRKNERMEAIVQYYIHGNREAVDRFPDGDPEPNVQRRPKRARARSSRKHVQSNQ